jgi:hypothetical protein
LWEQSFPNASPWNGTTSAGNSGSIHYATLGTIPSAGATLNGFATASFNGTTQALSTSTETFSDIHDPGGVVGSISAYSGWILVKPTVVTATYFLFADSGAIGTAACMYAVQIASSNASITSANNKTATRAISAGAWSLITYRWDSANLQIGVNENPGAAGGASTIADTTTPINDTGSSTRFGCSVSNTLFYSGLLEENAACGQALSNATFTGVRAWLSARYALSL